MSRPNHRFGIDKNGKRWCELTSLSPIVRGKFQVCREIDQELDTITEFETSNVAISEALKISSGWDKPKGVRSRTRAAVSISLSAMQTCPPVFALLEGHELIFLHDTKRAVERDYLCWCVSCDMGCYVNGEKFESAVGDSQTFGLERSSGGNAPGTAQTPTGRDTQIPTSSQAPTIVGPDGRCYYCDAKPCVCRAIGLLESASLTG